MGKNNRKQKIGRNDPCPCGSGKKLKKCHGNIQGQSIKMPSAPSLQSLLKKKMDEHQANEMQRKKQQGLGRPIISTDFKGHRVIAIGKELRWSEKWKTFHDFLFDYLKYCFEKEWWMGELKKNPQERHPILQWAVIAGEYTSQLHRKYGEIHAAPTIGAVDAYLGLSYSLYLLAHNAELQTSLVARLKHRDQFLGAYYETFVAATFIKAGFELVLEDETDVSTSHCEFTATYKETGRKFSVEAKARQGGDSSPDVGGQLYRALIKRADHARIVFIELNHPRLANEEAADEFAGQISSNLRELEGRLTIKGSPAPEAYVFLTNFPYQYNLDKTNINIFALSEGYKIPEFKPKLSAANIREALRVRKEHYEMFKLMDSIKKHRGVPSTFDGEIPELTYGKTVSRLKVGERYMIPDENGNEVVGELLEATVAWEKCLGSYRLEDGRIILATCPMTEDELVAYRKYPDTFFGVYKQQGRKAETPLDLFDFFYDCYKETPKEKLLELMDKYPDLDQLRNHDHEELVITFCERHVYSAMQRGVFKNH